MVAVCCSWFVVVGRMVVCVACCLSCVTVYRISCAARCVLFVVCWLLFAV